ncbi:hypothetical protein LC609_19000 [Nostoc sp. XA013]|nr:hypothetical protein [Nostoc sp. XA013]
MTFVKVGSLQKRLNGKSQSIHDSNQVAPPGCRIARYSAKGRKAFYWYYKLQAITAIFPTQIDGKLSSYKHLGKAGSLAYIDAIEQITQGLKLKL